MTSDIVIFGLTAAVVIAMCAGALFHHFATREKPLKIRVSKREKPFI